MKNLRILNVRTISRETRKPAEFNIYGKPYRQFVLFYRFVPIISTFYNNQA